MAKYFCLILILRLRGNGILVGGEGGLGMRNKEGGGRNLAMRKNVYSGE
jgi:hypothetical protein